MGKKSGSGSAYPPQFGSGSGTRIYEVGPDEHVIMTNTAHVTDTGATIPGAAEGFITGRSPSGNPQVLVTSEGALHDLAPTQQVGQDRALEGPVSGAEREIG